MPDSESNLVSSHVDVINRTSVLSEMKISDGKRSVERRAVTQIGKNGYPDSIYINAAKIFQGIRTERSSGRILVRYGDTSEPPVVAFKDEHSRRESYELAFRALKYQDLLEEMLLDSKVYPCYSIPDELTSLLVVMLCDLQDRKFEKRKVFAEEEPVAEVQEIGHYLYRYKTKLAAALARCRIKYDALSIEYFVPETISKQEQRTSAVPVCFWINTFKIREELLNLDLFADCKLLLQDKSRSLAVHSAHALLSEGGDIIMAHIGSHLTTAHMSVLTNDSSSKIFVCGVKSSAKEEELRNNFSHMGCENIWLLHEDFIELQPTDPRLEKAKVILLLPQCSELGAGNPMELILSEHSDAGLLRDLFQGFVSEDKLRILTERQLNELIHALKFNKVQAIVYCTCSVYPEENELVVKKALESGVEGDKRPYRLIPSIFSTCSNSESSTEMFFKIEPSEISSGCFLAVLEREKKVSAKDILASAAAKALLGDIVEEKPKEEVKKPKVKQRRRKAAASDSKPKAAKDLHHHTGANVKAEVPVSKAASKIQEKQVCPTKAGSNTPQKTVQGKKAASDTPQKTVQGKKAASNTSQKTVQGKKAASDTPQKTVEGKKAASDTPQKTVQGKKAASNTPQKNVRRTKAASNVSVPKAASTTQQKKVPRTDSCVELKKSVNPD
ncbi:putative methyltransferase NSUN7 isoform X2 [Passer domesticus]|uniref:putative methyltransferase NSUN7 isoform X2 n=1 Tax=Passer domesticus TaxID=48849 RepID=UPI0030FE8463